MLNPNIFKYDLVRITSGIYNITEKGKRDFRLIFQIGALYIQDGTSFPLDVPSEKVLLSV